MKKNVLLALIYFCLIIQNVYSKDINILQELEFYSEGKNQYELKEQNKSAIKESLNISQQQIDELIDSRQKLSGDKNNLKILDQNIKINHSDDLIFIDDKQINRKHINEVEDINHQDIKNIQVDLMSSPILRFVTKTIRPFLEARIDNILMRMGVITKLTEAIDISSKLKIHIIKDGAEDSKAITCGNNVEISLKIEDEYGNNIHTDYENQRLWLTVGQKNFTMGLELGLIGAKIGEEREVIAPFPLNIGNSLFAQQLLKATKQAAFKVKIHDISEDEELEKIQKNLRYYDGMASLSRQLSCGDIVKTDLRLLNAKGEILFEKPKDQIIYLILGSNVSKYLEQILLGVHSGGTRIALSSTENLETLKRIPALKGIEKILNEYSGVVIELSPTFALQ